MNKLEDDEIIVGRVGDLGNAYTPVTAILSLNPSEARRTKKQILENQEDSEKYHKDRHKIVKSFKKWEQRNKEAKKDRQIVEKLKERIQIHKQGNELLKGKLPPDEKSKMFMACQSDMLEELQKILEEKKK